LTQGGIIGWWICSTICYFGASPDPLDLYEAVGDPVLPENKIKNGNILKQKNFVDAKLASIVI
jgi:hypothetical protein